MAGNYQDEYDKLKTENAALQAEVEKLKAADPNAKHDPDNKGGATKAANKGEDDEANNKNSMDNEDLKARVAAMEKREEEREAAEKHALATKLAKLDIEARKIPESKFDEQVKMHGEKTAAELHAALPYAEDMARGKREASARQASRMAPNIRESRFGGDPNEEGNKQAATEIGAASKEFRGSLYG